MQVLNKIKNFVSDGQLADALDLTNKVVVERQMLLTELFAEHGHEIVFE